MSGVRMRHRPMKRSPKNLSSAEHCRRSVQAAVAHLPAFHDPAVLAMALAALATHASMAAPGSYSEEMLRRARRGQIRKPTKEERAARRRGELSSDRAREIAAYDHVVFPRRAAKAGPGQTIRERLGHRAETAPTPTASVVLAQTPAGLPVELRNVEMSVRNVRRAARYEGLVGQLKAGHISPEAFRSRVRRWKPFAVTGPPELVGIYFFLSDPDTVLAFAIRERLEDIDVWFTS